MSLTRDPVYECKDDLLKVHWAADHFYSADTKEPSKPVLDNVKEKLNNSYIMKTLGFFVPFHQPPMIEAKQDTKGDYVQVFLHSSCTIRSQNYNAVTDTCA
ncbi:hypothetical protein EB796_018214 [Bugula neritina]|uniref:Uncharacterized protein n=1 Tax=Bugula neritina TaxID=10212 RepID=A0A7J7JB48_BUGNE|nr:hypothetical protein EB796_018214 [Bugula neritina]